MFALLNGGHAFFEIVADFSQGHRSEPVDNHGLSGSQSIADAGIDGFFDEAFWIVIGEAQRKHFG